MKGAKTFLGGQCSSSGPNETADSSDKEEMVGICVGALRQGASPVTSHHVLSTCNTAPRSLSLLLSASLGVRQNFF